MNESIAGKFYPPTTTIDNFPVGVISFDTHIPINLDDLSFYLQNRIFGMKGKPDADTLKRLIGDYCLCLKMNRKLKVR